MSKLKLKKILRLLISKKFKRVLKIFGRYNIVNNFQVKSYNQNWKNLYKVKNFWSKCKGFY